MPKSKQARILIAAIFLYIVIFCFVTLKKYYNFGYNAFDLAIFNQVFFNTLHGAWFHLTVNINNYLADHFSPIIFALLPFYALRQAPESLLVLQSIVSALGAWPLYLIARQVTKSNKLALGVGLLWLLNPFVHNANLYEWHILAIAAFLIFWTFYFYLKNNFKLYILFFILSLACREDIALIMLGFGFLSFIDKKNIYWKLFSFILPLIYFLAAIKLISHYAVTDDYKFFVYYGWLGGETLPGILWSWFRHPGQVFLHIFSFKNLFGLGVVLLPWLFLPILRPKYWLLCVLPILQFMLTGSGFNFLVYSNHYALLVLPGLLISLIFALDKIYRQAKHKNLIIILLSVSGLYFLIFLSPLSRGLFAKYDPDIRQAKAGLIASIAPQASVAAELSLQPVLSSRQTIYALEYSYYGSGQFAAFSFDLPLVDYIAVDYSNFISTLIDAQKNYFLQATRDAMPGHWRKILEGYALVKAENNLYLWQNKNKAGTLDLKFYEINKKPTDFNNNDFLVSSSRENNALKLAFQKKSEQEASYLVRFYKPDGYFDIPLDYGIYPESKWSGDSLYSFYYYPDSQVESFEIFSWTGTNILGHAKENAVKLDLEPVTTKIEL